MHHIVTSKSGKAIFTTANALLTMKAHKHITEKLTGSKRLFSQQKNKTQTEAEKSQ